MRFNKMLPYPVPKFDENGMITICYFKRGAGAHDTCYTTFEKSSGTKDNNKLIPINFSIASIKVAGILTTADGWIPVDICEGSDLDFDEFWDCDYVAFNPKIHDNVVMKGATRNFFLSKEEAEGVAEYIQNFKKELIR